MDTPPIYFFFCWALLGLPPFPLNVTIDVTNVRQRLA